MVVINSTFATMINSVFKTWLKPISCQEGIRNKFPKNVQFSLAKFQNQKTNLHEKL